MMLYFALEHKYPRAIHKMLTTSLPEETDADNQQVDGHFVKWVFLVWIVQLEA
jgi:hypothetical protein